MEEATAIPDVFNLAYEKERTNYAEAMRSSKREEWKVAMCEEIQALQKNDFWRVAKRGANSNPLHLKGVYKTKTGANGELKRHKARLVACGNEQVFGDGHTLTFAAVMDFSTVKIVLALAAAWVSRPSLVTS